MAVVDDAFVRETFCGEVEERFGERDVDVYGASSAPFRHDERLVAEPVAQPALVVVVWLRQRDGEGCEASEGVVLWQCLSVELVDPRLRSVSRDHYDALPAVCRLSHSRHDVEHRRAACDADGDGLAYSRAQTEGNESRRAFVCCGMADDVRVLAEVMHQGRIAASGTHDDMAYAVGHQECCQRVDTMDIAIHGLWSLSLLPSPSILLRSGSRA